MATYNSTLIAAGGGQATPTIVPGAAKLIYGSVTVPAGVALATNDTLPLFNLGAASAAHITSYVLDSGAMDAGASLIMSMLDSNTSPTTFFSGATQFRTAAVLTNLTVGTAAAHGTLGSAISYTAPSLIYLRATTGGTGNLASAQTIYFWFEVARD